MTRRLNLRAFAGLEWNRVERGLAVLAILAATHLWILAGAFYALAREDRAHLVAVPVVQAQLPVLAGFAAGAILLFLLGLCLRRWRPGSLVFQHLCATYHVLTLAWVGYQIGSLSLPTGSVMMGSVLVGYIVLERVVVRSAFALGAVLLLVLNLAAAQGLLPYAPALLSPSAGGDALFWTAATFYLATPYLGICIVAMAFMLGLWQRREGYVLRLGLTDGLTGVHNRRSILAQLEAELARLRGENRPLAVAILDLDHFKRVNDRFGHPTGDRVLKEAAKVLRGCLRAEDSLGRFGGEEFLLLLPGVGHEVALTVLERCRAGLAGLVVTADDGERIPVSASFGLAWCATLAGISAEALVQAADGRLAAAKQGGRNRIESVEVAATPAAVPATTPRVMREAPPKARALQLLREFLNGWQTWSPVDKQIFHLGLSVALFANYMVWAVYLLLRDDRGALVDMAMHGPAMTMMTGVIAGYGVLITVGLLIRRRWPDSRLYQVVGQQYFGLSLIGVGHVIGILGFSTGIMLVSMPLVGFLYFERRIVWWSLATPLLLVVVLGFASATGLVPYAPALAEGMDRHQPHSLFWVLSFHHFTWITMAVIVMLADYTIGRWRVRGEQVVALSRTDTLTQVHNRRSILHLLEKEVARARESGVPLAVVVLDIDNFKRINDTWGHPTGDRVLQETARILAATLRDGDHIGRYGGEEFLLLLPATALEGARALVERCRAQLAATVVTAEGGSNFFISASFGVVGSGAGSALAIPEGEALFRAADAALYRAKETGRNRVEVGTLA
ncbi:MAG: hypothetical protein K0R03_2273 [Moraxellaceae bacterium]|jgi:diguanylate cyclase (GGDEF)-like protein|nr:hypothetical protein [Moraxellaceae bacterium]